MKNKTKNPFLEVLKNIATENNRINEIRIILITEKSSLEVKYSLYINMIIAKFMYIEK